MLYHESHSELIYKTALNYLGTAEVPGKAKSNPLIVSWILKALPWLDKNTNDGDVAWCGIFAAQVLRAAGLEDFIPKAFYRARNWKLVGERIPLEDACAGDLAIFWRESPKGLKKHVAFISKENLFETVGDRQVYMPKVLGGNQKNRVGIDHYTYQRLEEIRRIPKFKVSTNMFRGRDFNFIEKLIFKLI